VQFQVGRDNARLGSVIEKGCGHALGTSEQKAGAQKTARAW